MPQVDINQFNELKKTVDSLTRKTDALKAGQKTLTDLGEKIHGIDKTVHSWTGGGAKVLIGVISALLGLVAWLGYHSLESSISDLGTSIGNLQKDLNQVREDVGKINGELLSKVAITNLNNLSSDPQKAGQQLAQTNAVFTDARLRSVKVDASTSSQISAGLLQAVDTHPLVPQVWETAASFISYRSDLRQGFQIPSLPDCVDSDLINGDDIKGAPKGTWITAGGNNVRYFSVAMVNCKLDLNDEAAFQRYVGNVAKIIVLNPSEKRVFQILLRNVRVIYRGGPLLSSVESFHFVNCTFDIQTPPLLPNRREQELTAALLQADSGTGSVTFTSDDAPS